MLPKYDDDDFNTCLALQDLMFKEVLFEWKRNYGSRKIPDYKPLCTYVCKYVHGRLRRNFDLHYVNPVLSSGGSADVAFYCLKYMMKPSNRQIRLQRALHLNLDEDEYNSIWSLVKCRHFESEALGLGSSEFDLVDNRKRYRIPDKIYNYLRSGIDLSKKEKVEPFAKFFSPIDGKSVPLADYYKSVGSLYTMQDFLDFFYASTQPADNIIVCDDENVSQIDKAISDFEEKVEIVVFRQTASELDDLFDDSFSDNLFLDF